MYQLKYYEYIHMAATMSMVIGIGFGPQHIVEDDNLKLLRVSIQQKIRPILI